MVEKLMAFSAPIRGGRFCGCIQVGMVLFHTSRMERSPRSSPVDQGLDFGTGNHFVGNLGACLLYFSGLMYHSLFFPFSFISRSSSSNAFSFSRFLLSIFVSLSDSPRVNGPFCEFFSVWVLCNFLQFSLSSFVKLRLKRLILLSSVCEVFLSRLP